MPHVDLEGGIERVRRSTADPRAGIYGPGSVAWRINREAVVMMGGGRAALLQLAHPFVAHAVMDHSDTRTDPVGRLRRTFVSVFAIAFGDLERALATARRIHHIHTHITGHIPEDVGRFRAGDRYAANDPEALLWVHATLLDTAVLVYEHIVEPVSDADKERLYQESRRFAWLFGVPDELLPADWRAFQRYMASMVASDTIAVGSAALHMRRFLFQPPTRVHGPLAAWYEAFTTSLMPKSLRASFDLSWGAREEALVAATLPLVRTSYRNLPTRLRYFPDYVEAIGRLEGRPRRDRFGRLLERLAMESLQPSAAILEREKRARRVN